MRRNLPFKNRKLKITHHEPRNLSTRKLVYQKTSKHQRNRKVQNYFELVGNLWSTLKIQIWKAQEQNGIRTIDEQYSNTHQYGWYRAVFKWLSKVITWLRLLRLVIGLKESRQFFNQWEAKPKPIAPRTRDFSRASSELPVIARNCDWFIALLAPIVIGRSNCFGFGFSTVIWKPR